MCLRACGRLDRSAESHASLLGLFARVCGRPAWRTRAPTTGTCVHALLMDWATLVRSFYVEHFRLLSLVTIERGSKVDGDGVEMNARTCLDN